METSLNVITDNFYNSGYSVTEHFLSLSEVDVILDRIRELKEENAFKLAGIGNNAAFQKNENIRNDFIYWIEPGVSPFGEIFFSRMDELVQLLNRRCFIGIKDYEFHLAHYEAGSFYKKHRDAFRSDDARKVSVICYLNKSWSPKDGGELKLYFDDAPGLTIEPLAGRLVVFESHLEHEVLPSHNDRYSITGWLKNKSRLI